MVFLGPHRGATDRIVEQRQIGQPTRTHPLGIEAYVDLFHLFALQKRMSQLPVLQLLLCNPQIGLAEQTKLKGILRIL
jgi:hypothetical protein